MCAVCRRPVFFFSESYDPLRYVTVYTARCHGAEQIVELGAQQVMNAGPDGIEVGMAFTGMKQIDDQRNL